MREINTELWEKAEELEEQLGPVYRQIEKTAAKNHARVLNAFRQARISDQHLKGTSGYGYSDIGRQGVEDVFAGVFNAEAALVRGQIVSGTHAIALGLFGVLRPGDELLSVTGEPYDTLQELIGIRSGVPGSLKEFGVSYRQVELTASGQLDWPAIELAVTAKTRMVLIQRSRGYAWRSALAVEDIGRVCEGLKKLNPGIVTFVDNCYGELVETVEPTAVGADLAAGSLIKNLGGGLAPTGGYVAGKKEFVEMAANRLTSPGIGAAVGATLDLNRWLLQGIYMAPAAVREALKGAVFTASLFENLGFQVSPGSREYRGDLIQGIRLGSPELMVAFCRGLQHASPVDSHIIPEPWQMPGYDDEVVMAGGTFTQGSTIELSADGPIRPPYAIYLQGGLSLDYTRLSVLGAAQACQDILKK
ncbi:MAG: aminotransferase class I/II-fold pyridoxal phosphate-dependent enzyme [Bacillota bacterium]